MNLAKDPIPLLVGRIAFPVSVGWFFNNMFNVVDTFWAGQLSAQAIAALSLSMIPFLGLLSLGIGLGQGTNALVSNALGAQQNERAVRLIAQALLLSVIASGLVLLLGQTFTPMLYRYMGAEESYLEMALSYIDWLIYGYFTFIINLTANAGLNQGHTKTYRNALIYGFLANIGLDPLLMFGWGPFPNLGVEGIAIATILIQLVIVLYIITKVRQSSLGQQLRFEYFKPQKGFIVGFASSRIALYDQHDVDCIKFLRNFVLCLRLWEKCCRCFWRLYEDCSGNIIADGRLQCSCFVVNGL